MSATVDKRLIDEELIEANTKKSTVNVRGIQWKAVTKVVSFAAVIWVVTHSSPHWGEALRDEPNNGCEQPSVTKRECVTSLPWMDVNLTPGQDAKPSLKRSQRWNRLGNLFISKGTYAERFIIFQSWTFLGKVDLSTFTWHKKTRRWERFSG